MPPDVVYDEHGQTWDVYGAEFDPVILGRPVRYSARTTLLNLSSSRASVKSSARQVCRGYVDPHRDPHGYWYVVGMGIEIPSPRQP